MAETQSEEKAGVAAVRNRVLSALVRNLLRSRMFLALALASIGGIGWAIYYYRSALQDGLVTTQDSVLSYLGLGVIPAAIWLIGAAGMLRFRRQQLGVAKTWAASVVFLAAVLGILTFFSAESGTIAYFTLDGDVRLGGKIGEGIAGGVGQTFTGVSYWTGALRVAAVFLVGVAIASPSMARVAASGFVDVVIYVYVTFIVGAKAALSLMRRLYRYEPSTGREQAALATDGSSLGQTQTAALTGVPSSSLTGDPGLPTAVEDEGNVDPLDEPGEDDPRAVDAAHEPDDETEGVAVEDRAVTGRFNRFWDLTNPKRGDESSVTATQSQANGVSSIAADGQETTDEDDSPLQVVSAWSKPPIYILQDTPESGISDEEISGTAETIQTTLEDYGVEVEIGQVRPGPAVTMYGLTPGWVRRYKQVREKNEDGTPKLDISGKQIVRREETRTRVKVDSILQREKDLALALKTPSIRIETPVMGESLLGIEVPNPNPSLVTLRSVMESEEFGRLRSGAHLPVALGKGSGGETVVIDLARMPHLLIAGATGSGKSVCINGIVSCLMMEKTPDEMRMLLIDPKRVELTPYNGIPHLLTPVVVETDQVVGLLKGLIREMMDRYRRMEDLSVRNIEAYNRKAGDKMPFLVVAIDELADLMMTASFDVEQSLCRLAQLGRATGIHLIIATQRPSVDVLTGLIKANFPSRISFGVTSQIDSRTILDTSGAEKLLGRGDMLYQPIDASRPERVQSVWISDTEVDELVRFWQATPQGPLPEVNLQAVPDDDVLDGVDRSEDRDELMDRAIEMAQTHSKLSTSLLQRRLRVGYPRAARLMDQLEDEGIVGPSDGSRSRDVIIGSS